MYPMIGTGMFGIYKSFFITVRKMLIATILNKKQNWLHYHRHGFFSDSPNISMPFARYINSNSRSLSDYELNVSAK